MKLLTTYSGRLNADRTFLTAVMFRIGNSGPVATVRRNGATFCSTDLAIFATRVDYKITKENSK